MSHTRPSPAARLRLEQLEDREVPAVIPGFSESVFASGLVLPTAMAVAPDGRIFVAEKGGNLRVVQNGTVLATPFTTLSVNTVSERGLIGVALDPNFAANGFVYVYYTTNATTPVNRVSRFVANPLDPNVAIGSEQILLTDIPSTNGNHNGGALVFGADGTLLIGAGDAGVSSNAQSFTTLAGKVLRINPDGSIPTDNPFVGAGGGTRTEIYAAGLRNPFTMAIQPGTSQFGIGRLFINDVGQSSFEEINEGAPGANYGWPSTEGPNPPNVAGVTYPIYSYAHGTGSLQGDSIAGGAFYNPTTASFPSNYVGDYIFGDFVRSRIFVRDATSGTVSTLAPQTAGAGVVDIDVLPDGSVLYLSLNTGTVYKISAETPPTANSQVVAAGSGQGAFPAVIAYNPDGSAKFVAATFPVYAGVRVATGDVNGDGVEDVIATSGPGGPPVVTVYDGRSGQAINAFFAIDNRLRTGLSVTAGDLDGDGRAEIIVGTASAASFVAVLDGMTGQVTKSFFAFPGYSGGVNLASGDVDGDGRADIIVGTATGISAVAVFSGKDGTQLRQFLAFGTAPLGANVGFAGGEILVGTASGPPVVAVYGSGGQLRTFFVAGSAAIPGGARVSGNAGQIVVGVGPAVLTYDRPTATLLRARLAFDNLALGNVFVG